VAKKPFKNYETSLKAGDKAPDFSAKDQNGNLVSLKDLRGKKVVLYFYPNDDTPTCTNEACNLRDNYEVLKKQGYEVIGVSENDERSHQKFIKKYKLPFTLIADTDHKVIDAYDVWGKKQFMGIKFMGLVRTTFVINEEGMIEDVITKVKSKEHADQIMQGEE
jgi:peroxiredoxin Q/BCP